MATTSPDHRTLAVFALVCFGQVISQFGSQLTLFVLGVWVFETTGSATQFSLISFFAVLPQTLVLPFAGALVDRLDRRWIMILADFGSGLTTLVLLFLIGSGRLEIWHIYPIVGVSACFNALQVPAFSASTVMLVPKQHLMRANGAVEMGIALALMAAPVSAGALLGKIGLVGVVVIDVVTFLIAVVTLLLVRIPSPESEEGGDRRSLLRDAVFGWTYVRTRHGLLGLLGLFAAVNLTFGMVQVGLTPLILSFASSAQLGIVLSIATTGMVVGGLGVVVWGGPTHHRMRLILAMLAVQGGILFFGGVRPSVPLVAGAAFIFTFCQPVVLACSQAIWQTKVPPNLQGRVFAIRRLVATSTTPVAFLAVGPLADYFLEPWLAADGALAGTVGRLIGVGPGRGLGFLFVILGAVTLVALLVALAYRPLRNLEDELPDADATVSGQGASD
ncbi:MAG: MFS transporter [Acidobacteriota bacterium]